MSYSDNYYQAQPNQYGTQRTNATGVPQQQRQSNRMPQAPLASTAPQVSASSSRDYQQQSNQYGTHLSTPINVPQQRQHTGMSHASQVSVSPSRDYQQQCGYHYVSRFHQTTIEANLLIPKHTKDSKVMLNPRTRPAIRLPWDRLLLSQFLPPAVLTNVAQVDNQQLFTLTPRDLYNEAPRDTQQPVTLPQVALSGAVPLHTQHLFTLSPLALSGAAPQHIQQLSTLPPPAPVLPTPDSQELITTALLHKHMIRPVPRIPGRSRHLILMSPTVTAQTSLVVLALVIRRLPT